MSPKLLTKKCDRCSKLYHFEPWIWDRIETSSLGRTPVYHRGPDVECGGVFVATVESLVSRIKDREEETK